MPNVTLLIEPNDLKALLEKQVQIGKDIAAKGWAFDRLAMIKEKPDLFVNVPIDWQALQAATSEFEGYWGWDDFNVTLLGQAFEAAGGVAPLDDYRKIGTPIEDVTRTEGVAPECR